jgi:hypothetical protein
MEVGAGYRNEYGTRVDVGLDPVRQGVRGTADFPLGDHQSGWNMGVEAGWDPESGGSAMLRFGKRNVPRVDEGAVEAILGRHLQQARELGLPASEALTGELRQRVRRDMVDARMGVGAPGQEKFGFYLGLNGPSGNPGAMPPGMPAGVPMEETMERQGATVMPARWVP